MKPFTPTLRYVDEEYYENTSYMDPLANIKEYNLSVYFGIPIKSTLKKISDPYFKVYRYANDEQGTFTDLCRISMVKPEYITGMNESMVLTDEEIDAFFNTISGEKINSIASTCYESAIDDINRNMRGCHYLWWRKLSYDYIPNYKLLKSP